MEIATPPTLKTIFADMVRPAPPDYRARILRMVEDYEGVFGGHETEMTVLDRFLAQDEKPCTLLLSPTGRGKTALLLHWLVRVYRAGDWSIIFAPISMRYRTASADATLRMLVHTLAAFHHDSEQMQTYNIAPYHLRPIIADYLHRNSPDGRRLLLVLDGLDETVGWQVEHDLFPRTLGRHVRIIATARQSMTMTRDDWLAALGWSTHQTYDLVLPTLSQAEMDDILHRMCQSVNGVDVTCDLHAHISRVSQGDPFTMTLLIEALQDQTLTPDRLAAMSPGLEAYIWNWLQERELQHTETAAMSTTTILGMCTTALGPLTNDDLLQLVPQVFHTQDDIVQAAHGARHFITGDGSNNNGYVFRHPRLHELFLEQVFSQRERENFHQHFVTYGLAWYSSYPSHPLSLASTLVPGTSPIKGRRFKGETLSPLTDYLRQLWIEHLAAAGAWDAIRTVLTETVFNENGFQQPWLTARFAAEGSYAGYLSDLDILWRWADQHNDISLGVRCALIASTIRSMSGNLLPALLVRLMTVGVPEGRWSVPVALNHVRLMPAPGQKVKALKALVECSCDISTDLMLDIADTFTDEGWRAEALMVLLPHLPPDMLPSVLAEVRAMSDARWRTRALTALADYLPHQQQTAVYAEVLESASSIRQSATCSRVLVYVIPHLPAALLPDALAVVATIPNERSHTEALLALLMHPQAADWPAISAHAPAMVQSLMQAQKYSEAIQLIASHTPAEQQHEAFTSMLADVRAIEHPGARAHALTALAPSLTTAQQAACFAEALDAAQTIQNHSRRLPMLADIIPHLPADQQASVAMAEYEVARSIPDERERLDTLRVLMPLMPDHMHAEVYAELLDAARTVPDTKWRAATLATLIPTLSPSHQPAVCMEALVAARAIPDEWQRAELLVTLAPHVPAAMLPDILDIVRGVSDPWQRAEVLTAIGPYLPAPQQPYLYAEALAASRALIDEPGRVAALAAMLPHIPAARQAAVGTEAMVLVQMCADPCQRAEMLAQLVPYMPTDQQHDGSIEALTATRTGTHQGWCMEALLALVPLVPATVLSEVVEPARAIEHEWYRFEVLRILAPRLPADQQHALYAELLVATRSFEDEWQQTEALRVLAPHLPDALYSDVLDIVRAMQHEIHHTRTLKEIAPYLPSSLFDTCLELIPTISNEKWRAEVLIACAPHVPAPSIPALLASARAIQDSANRARVLSVLVAYLPPAQQAEIYTETLAAVRTISYVKWRADVLAELVAHIPAAMLPEVLEIARTIGDAEERCKVMTALAPRMPATVLPEALAAACAIPDEAQRASALVVLAPDLPAGLLSEAIAAVYAIDDEQERNRALNALAPHLSQAQRTDLYANALEMARAIPDPQQRVLSLASLAPHLPDPQQADVYTEALALARDLPSRRGQRRQALAQLAEQLATWSVRSTVTLAAALKLWQETMRMLAAYGRQEFLDDFTVLIPWLKAMSTPQQMGAVADAMVEVTRCWP